MILVVLNKLCRVQDPYKQGLINNRQLMQLNSAMNGLEQSEHFANGVNSIRITDSKPASLLAAHVPSIPLHLASQIVLLVQNCLMMEAGHEGSPTAGFDHHHEIVIG
jgi:hypothetical protein